MATKGLVLSVAEHPAFVQSNLVHQSLQTTKDVATQMAVPIPIRALREAKASSIRAKESCRQEEISRLEAGLRREVMLNKPDEFLEQQHAEEQG